MKISGLFFLFAVASLAPLSVEAQSTLNTTPSRSLGQDKFELNPRSGNPNLVEGREFFYPWFVTVDRNSTPPAVYVSDAFNNRVLGWKNANSFLSGSTADIVIGQLDLFTTTASGPGTSRSIGLSLPGALAVDTKSNLYVVDSNNNRILRYPNPFNQTDDLKQPDMVIGQSGFTTNTANNGSLSEKSLNVAGANTGMIFDGSGNLYVSDTNNNRVLRYPATALSSGVNNPSADLVLGQPGFNVNAQGTNDQRLVKTVMKNPSGLAIDSNGHLFVCDGISRVLVFSPPFLIGAAAARIMGIPAFVPGPQPTPTATEYTLSNPEGVFMMGNNPVVVDTLANRILKYDPFESWPAETPTPAPAGSSVFISPPAKFVIGQIDFVSSKANKGLGDPSETSLSQPQSGVMLGSDMYVADTGNNRVLVIPQSGQAGVGVTASRVLGQIGFNYGAPNLIEGKEFYVYAGFSANSNIGGDLSDGAGVTIDNTSNPPRLYVADTFNNRILGFKDARVAKNGDKADIVIGQLDLLRNTTNSPSGDPTVQNDTGLFHPGGVAVDAKGDLWVADGGNARVLRFPAPFSQPAGVRQRANLVLGQRSFNSKLTDATASTMAFPYGIAFTSSGGVLVSDSANFRVLLFKKPAGGDFVSGQAADKAFGQFDLRTGFRATGDKRFNAPRGIATDTDDRLYVVDVFNNRIAIYDNVNGNTVDPAPALSLGGLNNPQGIYVSPFTGEIWVADTRNNRVLRFPRFDKLAFGSNPDFAASAAAPLAVAQDSFGNLFTVEATNRVSIFYNALAAKNSASYNDSRPISPGMITSLFTLSAGAVKFADSTTVGTIPLPTTLADTQVLVNGTAAPLYFVSPGQINFVVPMAVSTDIPADVTVVKPSTGQIIASYTFQVATVSPALFTSNGTGDGSVAALNDDNTVNSQTNQISKGKVITLFGTGAGPITGAPPDGQPATGAISSDIKPRIAIQNDFAADSDILYSGVAPGFPGMWQINLKIPDFVAPNPRVPIAITLQSVPSNVGEGGRRLSTFISVKQ